MPMLNIKNLKLGYDGKEILSDLNFSVEAGDYLFIVGENGSGKTTLMRAILGLVSPLSGEIEYSQGLLKNEIGYLPQQTEIQKDFPASVFEIVLSGCLNKVGLKPFYGKKYKQEALKVMEKVGISHLKKRSYKELSGGQQQRVLLARALLSAGKMLLLDEPVSSLDPEGATELYSLIEKLNGEGITVIMISHDMYAAKEYAKKILHIGKKTYFGSKEEYFEVEL